MTKRKPAPAKVRERIDLDDKGNVDDLAIHGVALVRLEAMDHNSFWMALTMPNGDDHVIWFNARGKVTVTHRKEEHLRLDPPRRKRK